MMMTMMAVAIPLLAGSAGAQERTYRTRSTSGSQARRTTTYKKPSLYRRHRNLFNIAMGTGAGAIIGGLVGGKRGAGIGAIAGAGGSALYTYKIKPKKRRFHSQYSPRY